MSIVLKMMQLQRQNTQFFFDMFKLISMPNRLSMKLLLNDGCVSYNQMRSDVMEIFYLLHQTPMPYETPMECNIFCSVLNSHISCYLWYVGNKYNRFGLFSQQLQFYSNIKSPELIFSENGYLSSEIPIIIADNSVLLNRRLINGPCIKESTKSALHKFNETDPDDKKMIEEFSLTFKIPVTSGNSESESSFFRNRKDSYENKHLPGVGDFQSFLSPLEQDYTKSSKGYICQNKSIDATTKLDNAVYALSDYNILNMDEVDGSIICVSDDENYDPAHDLIISRYFKSFESSSTSEGDCSEVIYNSDSDDSVVFSENVMGGMQERTISEGCRTNTYDKKIGLDVSVCYDSDSDDNVEFLEYFKNRSVKQSTKSNIRNICDTELDSDSSENNLFQNYYGLDSDSLFQAFDLSFRVNNEFSNISYSLSQNKIHVSTTDFEGYINPCFEDEIVSPKDNLKSINDKWEKTMQDVPSEPRQPKRVFFVPLPDLTSVQTFEPDEDCYGYSLYVLDQIRFKSRIQEFEEIIKPYLSLEHRKKVYECYYSSNN